MRRKPVETERLAIDGGAPVRRRPLPCGLPGVHWMGDEERTLVDQVIAARSPFRYYGPEPQGMVERFEREWCERFGHRHAVAVASGTAALSVALSALLIGPGDEVLLPGYLWVSCVAAVVRCGAVPRLVEIDETFCLDPEDLLAKIGPRSRAVLCVHMNGAPGRIQEVAAIARARGLDLIEDCSQAAGASSGGRAVGTFGSLATFSFQVNKNLTCGEGGLVATDDPVLHRRLVALHDLGYPRTPAGRLDTQDSAYQLWGYGVRMSELSGALALAQLRKLPRIVAAMRDAKWRIRRALEDLEGLAFRLLPDPEGDSGPFLITLYPDSESCEAVVRALRAEGIAGSEGIPLCQSLSEAGLHWYFNIPSLTGRHANDRSGSPWSHPDNAFAAGYAYGRGALPATDALHDRAALLSIPSNLAAADVDDIVRAFRKVVPAILAGR